MPTYHVFAVYTDDLKPFNFTTYANSVTEALQAVQKQIDNARGVYTPLAGIQVIRVVCGGIEFC